MTPFPWSEAMRFGLGVLRLPPSAFWAMTPRELGAAYQAFGVARMAPPARATLAAMMAAYPDREKGDG